MQIIIDLRIENFVTVSNKHDYRKVGPKFSGLTYRSRAKWKMLRGIYSAMYGEVNVSVCVEIKGDYIGKIAKLFYFCHLKKLVRPKTFGPTPVQSNSV
jgi:hypothetical protein